MTQNKKICRQAFVIYYLENTYQGRTLFTAKEILLHFKQADRYYKSLLSYYMWSKLKSRGVIHLYPYIVKCDRDLIETMSLLQSALLKKDPVLVSEYCNLQTDQEPYRSKYKHYGLSEVGRALIKQSFQNLQKIKDHV